MKRLLCILLLLLIFWAPVYAQAQSTNATTAGALGNSSSVCTNSSGLLTTSGCPSSGAATSETFVTIGNTSGLSAERALVGTSNQITVTDGGANGNVTLSLPQSINTGAAVSFGSVALTGTAGAGFEEYPAQSSAPSAPSSGFREYADSTGRKSWIRASDGFTRTWDATLTGNRVYTLPDANSTFPVASQVLTFSGPTAARTITLPDASFTAARTDAGQTFTGTQVFTSPKVITSVLDTNGNTFLAVTATGSAVNYLTLANAATTGSPTLSATGTDSNINITLTPKGTGSVSIGGQAISPAHTFSNGQGFYDEAANEVGLRNGSSAQKFDLYKTYTNSTTYEKLMFGVGLKSANTFGMRMLSNSDGSGTARGFEILTNDNTQMVSIGTSVAASPGITLHATSLSAALNGRVNISGANTNSATSGTHYDLRVQAGANPSSTSTMNYIPLDVTGTINYSAGTPGSGHYEMLSLSAVETALPTGTNYLIRAKAGAAGTTDEFTVTNGGVVNAIGGYKTNGTAGVSLTCSAMPTAMTITGGLITSVTGGTCS